MEGSGNYYSERNESGGGHTQHGHSHLGYI